MKRKIYSLCCMSLLLGTVVLIGCSSNDDSPSTPPSSSTSSKGEIPANQDNGKNNNSNPDNPSSSGDSGNNGGSGSGGSSDGTGGSGGSTGSTSEWTLVFEDDFEGTDETPNPEYWTLTPKGDKTWNRYMSGSYDQAYQKDGYLYLFGMLSNGQYLTGGIETLDKYSFTYGQVKCRARFLKQPQGNHTGIWMMPEPPAQTWPRSGEIDIMEHLNDESVIWETAHYWDGTTEETGEDAESHTSTSVDNDEFNVYGIIWDKNSVSFTVNGVVHHTYTNSDPSNEDFSYQYPFTKPFYLILSQSLGGEGTWEGPITDSELPAVFQIDWIKVWQKSE
ncbi:MAG: glycoside hydrolase family 16 protein [Muribaculaceae bacterium]|nr:glycoside hydrolase family 16 protein [Muribaculaceae bacterium]